MADRVGQQLGNYRIIQRLGSGGFADVYLGEHIYLKTSVAVKVLQARLSGPEDMSSFLQEAQMIARLIHPHIIRVTDFGVNDEVPFLVMDYAPNGTLRQKHPRGSQLPLTTLVPYVKQLADALQHAHDEKLIHRDIKPENMLLGRRNEVLLSDFGIALIAQSSRYQSTQDVVGTVSYMSPEQIQGKPRPASDQYSLGVVVYEWLSGDRPFRGSFTELCTQHMFAPPPPLREKIPDIAPDVEHVVMTALAKEPKQRFGSVQAFANALEQASRSVSSRHNVAIVPPTNVPPAQPERSPLPPARSVEVQQAPRTDNTPHTPSPLPPTVYAPPPSYPRPEQNAPQSPNLPPSQPASAQNGKKMSAWGINRRQLVAIVLGTVIYTIIHFLINALSLSNASFWLFPIGSYLPTPSTILISLSFTIPLFLATEFGVWTGGISSVVGLLLGNIFTGLFLLHANILASIPLWYIYIALTVYGFFPGLTLLHPNSKKPIILAVTMSAIGLIIGTLIFTIGAVLTFPNITWFPFLVNLMSGYTLPPLLLLPVILVIYKRIKQRKAQAV